jgi:4-alpha-glucanotransferase
VGILPGYIDQAGRRRHTTDRTRCALLAAMGIDAATEAQAIRAMESLRVAGREHVLPSVCVVEQRATRALPLSFSLGRSTGNQPAECEVEVQAEDGARHHAAWRARVSDVQHIAVRFASPLPLGYHTLRLAMRTRGGQRYEGEQSLIVTPGRCLSPAEKLGRKRVYGFLAQLYTLRSATNWGIGDLGDLRRLITWGGTVGAAFVGLNPLHALTNEGRDISPYSPVSRLYRNAIYLDIMAIPECAELPSLQDRLASSAFRRELACLRDGPHVQYERVMALKRPVLEALHRAFAARHGNRSTPRGRAYRRYVKAEGETLTDFATFLVLYQHLGRRHGWDWRAWPVAYRNPRSAAVRAFAARHAEEIDFHCYLQFELDRQLGLAAATARSADLTIGLYQDLAIGSSAVGSDTWAFSGEFANGVTLGAPPDTFYSMGQDWGFPPVDPGRLAASGYHYWIRLIRAAMAHAGALRIDHVMGLFRQFWVPSGRPPSEGAYVRYPSADLLGILALESARARALVIGEDLGTVPRGLPSQLARWNILSTRVLYFARSPRGTFLPARAYPDRSLASANTHDMPPLAGYWRERDIELRRQSGELRSAAAVEVARAERARERRALLRRLAAEELLPDDEAPRSNATLRGAVHAFLCRSPAALVGIALDDLVGETEPVNLPGVGPDCFPSWSRRLTLPIERFATDPEVQRALAGVLESPRAQRRGLAAQPPSKTTGRRGTKPAPSRGRA